MENYINEILNDLYMLDPELKKHDKELAVLAKTLLQSKPETKFDEQFAAELKSELMEKAQALKSSRVADSGKTGLFSALFANKFAYAAAGALIMLIVILPFLTNKQGIKLTRDPEKLAINFNEGIKSLDHNAFGALSEERDNLETAPGIGGGGGFARTQSGGGGGTLASPQAESMAASDSSAKMIAPRPDIINYEYTYIGDEINIKEEQMLVYKRAKTSAGSHALAQTITGFDFDLLDLSKFKDTELTNLNLNENREFGYSVHLNLVENTLDINQNWQKWPHPENLCRDQACYDRYRIKNIEEVPTDDRILTIAQEFISDYGIDVNNFGQPFLQNQWRRQYEYEIANKKSLAWIPEEMSVIYPYVIEGRMVYDQGGNPSGMYVGVNIKQNRVSNLHSIKPQTFESSQYDIINDSQKLIKLAEQGGFWPSYLYEGADRTMTVELGTPQLGLLQHWKYSSEEGTSDELYLPALIFPVKNLTELDENFYKTNIVVPLVKDILDEILPPVGMPEPMPLIKEEVNSVEAQETTLEQGEVKGEFEVSEPKEIKTQIRLEVE